MRNRRLLVGLALGCLAAGLCAGALLLAGLGAGWLYTRRVGLLASPTPRPTRDPDATARPAPTPGAETLAEMTEIEAWVIRQRGLLPNGDGVERKFLSEDEVFDRTIKDFQEDTSPEEMQDDVRVLSALGLVRPGLDLYNLYLRLYTEGVAGSYDPDTGELIVVSEAGALNTYEETTFAHEYNHALQDQNYDIRGLGFSDEGWETDSDKAAAVQALLEGDATLLDEQYQDTLSAAERREYDRAVDAVDVAIYFELPDFLLQDFFFPYQQGRDFVERYYEAGGWARVDEVWRDPPTSTEQILHPEKYDRRENPLPVPRPALTDTLGAGWRLLEENNLGEWYTYLILAYGEDVDFRLPESRAERAAAGWGGDAYAAFYNDAQDQIVLALHTQWDTAGDADEFSAAFADYADARFGRRVDFPGGQCWESAELHCFFRREAHSLWLIAPDEALITTLLAAYPDLP
jgi:hypothetical protein